MITPRRSSGTFEIFEGARVTYTIERRHALLNVKGWDECVWRGGDNQGAYAKLCLASEGANPCSPLAELLTVPSYLCYSNCDSAATSIVVR